MAKEYFSHDYNTRNKTKMAALIHYEKMKGYGLFWVIVEMLHEDSFKWMELEEFTYIAIKNASGCDVNYVKEFISKCIKTYKVFMQHGNKFTTERVLRNMEKREEITQKKSFAGKASAAKRRKKATPVEHLLNTTSTPVEHNPTKESKVKESKEKRESTPAPDLSASNLYRQPNIPTIDQVKESFHRNGGNNEMAEKFFLKHKATGWFLNGSPIVNFVSLIPSFVSNWKKNEPSKPAIQV